MRTKSTTITITSKNSSDREMTGLLLGESTKLTQRLLHLEDGGDVTITTPHGDAVISVTRRGPE